MLTAHHRSPLLCTLVLATGLGCGSEVAADVSSLAGEAGGAPEGGSGGAARGSGGTSGTHRGSGGAGRDASADAAGAGGASGGGAGTGGSTRNADSGGSAGTALATGGSNACDGSAGPPPGGGASSGNPILQGWYADPEIRVFGDKYYVYPTYSAPYTEQTFFEAFSSPDLVTWTNEGHVLDFANVSWSTNRAAWAPTATSRNGKYYFYFAAGDGAGIGVAVSTSPTGPFADALGKPLVGGFAHGAEPIDPYVFVDDDGQAYLYWGGWSHLVVAKLGTDMISVTSDATELTPAGYVEGPVMFKRNGAYYLMWSEGNWGDPSYCAAYATGTSPLGPFARIGKFLESNPQVGNGPGHNSVVNLPCTDEWYVVYHRRPIGEGDGNHRVTCIEHLHFGDDGKITPVALTTTGVTARLLGP